MNNTCNYSGWNKALLNIISAHMKVILVVVLKIYLINAKQSLPRYCYHADSKVTHVVILKNVTHKRYKSICINILKLSKCFHTKHQPCSAEGIFLHYLLVLKKERRVKPK